MTFMFYYVISKYIYIYLACLGLCSIYIKRSYPQQQVLPSSCPKSTEVPHGRRLGAEFGGRKNFLRTKFLNDLSLGKNVLFNA